MKRILLYFPILIMAFSCTHRMERASSVEPYIHIQYPLDSCRYAVPVRRWIDEVLVQHLQNAETGDLSEFSLGTHSVPTVYDTLWIRPCYESDEVVTYQAHEYQSIGETHPWIADVYVSFWKESGRRVLLSDLVTPTFQDSIHNLVLDRVDELKGQDTPTEFLSRSYHPRFHEPALMSDGWLFYFLPCEVGSDAEGEFRVVLPLDSI